MSLRTSSPVVISLQAIDQEWLFSLLFLLIVAVAEFVGLGRPLRTIGETVTQPVNLGMVQFLRAVTSPVLHLQSLETAQRRVQELERNYAQVSAQLGELDALTAENKVMREMLNVSDIRTQSRWLSLPIVSYGRPLIAGGEQQGLSSGMMVLAAQTLIGVVGSVSSSQSEVVLLNQEGAQPILVTTESGVQALVRGDGKRVLLTEVPVDVELKVGERVVTQGQVGIEPSMFVGRIASFKAEPTAAVQTAVIEQFVSFYEASLVEVR